MPTLLMALFEQTRYARSEKQIAFSEVLKTDAVIQKKSAKNVLFETFWLQFSLSISSTASDLPEPVFLSVMLQAHFFLRASKERVLGT